MRARKCAFTQSRLRPEPAGPSVTDVLMHHWHVSDLPGIIECMFEHIGIGAGGVLVHDVSVVDAMIHFARVSNIAESGKFTAIADLAMLRIDDQDGRQWWACDGWDAAVFIQRVKTLLETPALIFVEG